MVKLNLEVQTDFLKAIQGKADGVSFQGKGLKLQDISLTEFQIQTDEVDINPLKVLFGEVELNQPINAQTKIVAKEADINQALQLDLVRQLLHDFFTFHTEESIVSIYPQNVQFRLPGNKKIQIEGEIILDSGAEKKPLGFVADVRLESLEKPIVLDSFKCNTTEGIELEIMVALIDKIHKLRKSPYFKLKDAAFRVNTLEVQKGSIIILAQAQLAKIPDNIPSSE
ncbi:Protein of unknown function (DUF2993) [Rivularia sp. PCC 7116]|uniref:LmeA family phospholipid-binding protein n=1 Tax=Rivularia sp. PCC 7116 TaxID=373994 RepID=UPI00029F20A1|nr:DUF2993 domain-containing protein [Rivularia sp. PCC 7116]AFY54665.1 Protein of unknown function (DUF2993) [Rivularia sp. PCC 7116]